VSNKDIAKNRWVSANKMLIIKIFGIKIEAGGIPIRANKLAESQTLLSKLICLIILRE